MVGEVSKIESPSLYISYRSFQKCCNETFTLQCKDFFYITTVCKHLCKTVDVIVAHIADVSRLNGWEWVGVRGGWY